MDLWLEVYKTCDQGQDLKKRDREYRTPFSGHKVGGTHGISKLFIVWTNVPVQHATIRTLGILTHPWLTETENGNGTLIPFVSEANCRPLAHPLRWARIRAMILHDIVTHSLSSATCQLWLNQFMPSSRLNRIIQRVLHVEQRPLPWLMFQKYSM